jgi:integrase
MQAKTGTKKFERNGIVVRIRKTPKDGKSYFVVDYRVKGKRKLVWRSTMADARAAARQATDAIDAGEAEVLELRLSDRYAYLRACDALAGIEKIDVACQHYADAAKLLQGKTSIEDACRFWLKRHSVTLPNIAIVDAVEELKTRDRANVDASRMHQLEVLLGRFAEDFLEPVAAVHSGNVDSWLATLTKVKGGAMSEKSKRNYRDVIGYFCRFCVSKGYLAKDTNWLETARKYSAAKRGTIEIYTPDEFSKILERADRRLVPFLVINGFAGIRHEEIARMDWKDISLDVGDSFISIYADTAKTKVGRNVPVKDNLKAWLNDFHQVKGPVCEFANINKQLAKAASTAGLSWRKNALRHSYISYRKAECADIARVADEAGNSKEVIRSNYLKIIKPTEAARWFAITPDAPDNITKLHGEKAA